MEGIHRGLAETSSRQGKLAPNNFFLSPNRSKACRLLGAHHHMLNALCWAGL